MKREPLQHLREVLPGVKHRRRNTSLIRYMLALSLLLIFCGNVSAQTQVAGSVADDKGQPIPGASVNIKGTTSVTLTDKDGKFIISGPENGTIIFKYVGYVTLEEPINSRKQINVKLAEANVSLSEVVVVGYGTQKKETLVGSVVGVKGDVLEKTPSLSVSNSLAGRLPGVVALNRSGEPGSDMADILIRGSSTLGSNAPLIIIDGVAGREGLNELSPQDIESVSVLKDASAAIYGARAANGVILVTTKRGGVGKPTISYTFNQGFTQPTRIPDYADAATLAIFQNEQLVAGGQTAKFTDAQIQKFRDGSDQVNFPNTNWIDDALKDFSTQSQHALSVRGGSDNVKYYVSGNYSNQNGIFTNGISNSDVVGVRSNMDANITKNFRVSLDLSFQERNIKSPSVSTGTLMGDIYRNYPYLNDFFPNGLPGAGYNVSANPMIAVTDQAGYNARKVNRYQTTLSFDLKIPQVQGLGIDGFVAYDKNQNTTKLFEKPYMVYNYNSTTNTYNGVKAGGIVNPQLQETYFFTSALTANAKIKYDREFGDHKINAFIAFEQTENHLNNFSAFRKDFISGAIDELFAGGANNQVANGTASEAARRSYFSRIGYGYKGKYLVDVNLRYDGSSAFPKDGRWGFFPGVAAGWVLTEESFLKGKVKGLDFLKIRGSWGKMGNDAISPFQYLANYTFSTGSVLGNPNILSPGLTHSVEPNPYITWEVANTINGGLDAEFKNGLFGLTVDVFKTKRSNILTARDASIPIYTGLVLPLENIGVVENKGFEIELRHRNKIGNVQYTIKPNIAVAKNKILDIDEPASGVAWQRRTGQPMGAGLYYVSTGIFRTQQEIDANPKFPGTRIGDLKYEDFNHDGIINTLDQQRLGKTATPEVTFGMNLTVQYKSFDFNALIQGQTNAWRYTYIPQGLFGNVLTEMVENRPTAANPNSKYPNLTYDESQVSALRSDFWLRDASFIRLKNVEIGYTLSKTVASKLGINNLRLYVNGFNLFTIDKLKWFDPEGNADRGNFYPQNKIYNVGVNLSL